MKTELNFSISPEWPEIEKVFYAIKNFFDPDLFTKEQIDMFTMITCELVENSIKYGDFKIHKTIDIHLKKLSNKIIIIVKNPVGESSKPYLNDLDKTVQWVRGFQDSYEAYITRIKEISLEPMDNERSGIGLVRITYEGRATIDFFINDEKMLNVSAVSAIK